MVRRMGEDGKGTAKRGRVFLRGGYSGKPCGGDFRAQWYIRFI